MLIRAIIERVSHIVTVSDEFRDLLVLDTGCRKPVHALYNGVDTTQFRPRDKHACRRELGLPTDRAIFLYVGGLIERKGVNILLHALARHNQSNRRVELYLAGEGPQQNALRTLASSEGISDRVHFLGKVPTNLVHLWMGAADVLVLPSYSEGRPNVVLEAMASGTPVVATAVNGTAEVISAGVNGLLFEPGDVAGLAASLEKLLLEPDLAASLSARGIEKVAALGLTWTAHGNRLLSIYNAAIGDG
jgi:glycosyltransferase involved in cell wall biosynthesis